MARGRHHLAQLNEFGHGAQGRVCPEQHASLLEDVAYVGRHRALVQHETVGQKPLVNRARRLVHVVAVLAILDFRQQGDGPSDAVVGIVAGVRLHPACFCPHLAEPPSTRGMGLLVRSEVFHNLHRVHVNLLLEVGAGLEVHKVDGHVPCRVPEICRGGAVMLVDVQAFPELQQESINHDVHTDLPEEVEDGRAGLHLFHSVDGVSRHRDGDCVLPPDNILA